MMVLTSHVALDYFPTVLLHPCASQTCRSLWFRYPYLPSLTGIVDPSVLFIFRSFVTPLRSLPWRMIRDVKFPRLACKLRSKHEEFQDRHLSDSFCERAEERVEGFWVWMYPKVSVTVLALIDTTYRTPPSCSNSCSENARTFLKRCMVS